MPTRLLRWAKLLLPFPGLAFFVYLVYTLDVRSIANAFLSIDPRYVLMALSLSVPVVIIRIYAWQWICREQHIRIGNLRLLKIYLIGLFYGVGTPGYLGQIMRVPYMKDSSRAPYGKLFVNVVMETYIHTLSLYAMMIVGAVAIAGLLPQMLWLTVVWVAVMVGMFLVLMKKERGDRLFQWLIRVLVPRGVRGHVSSFTGTFYHDFPQLRTLLVPLGLGAVTWVLAFTQEYFMVLALGLPIPYLYFLVLFPIANTAGFLPVSVAGLGTREFTAIVIFTTVFAVSSADVFVLSLAGFIVTDVFLAAIGFFLSLTETRHPAETMVDS